MWPPQPLLDQLQAAAAAAGKRVALISAGRLGAGESIVDARCRRRTGRACRCFASANSRRARISELLQYRGLRHRNNAAGARRQERHGGGDVRPRAAGRGQPRRLPLAGADSGCRHARGGAGHPDGSRIWRRGCARRAGCPRHGGCPGWRRTVAWRFGRRGGNGTDMVVLSNPTGNTIVRAIARGAAPCRLAAVALHDDCVSRSRTAMAAEADPLAAAPAAFRGRVRARPHPSVAGIGPADRAGRRISLDRAARRARRRSRRCIANSIATSQGSIASNRMPAQRSDRIRLRRRRRIHLRGRPSRAAIACIYEMPIAHWQTVQRLLHEEAQRLPEWRQTIQGLDDSPAKLERKIREIEARRHDRRAQPVRARQPACRRCARPNAACSRRSARRRRAPRAGRVADARLAGRSA